MQVYAYVGGGSQYLLVPIKDDLSKVPPGVLATLGGRQNISFLKTFELADSKRVGLDSALAQADITAKGYHVTRVRIEFTERG